MNSPSSTQLETEIKSFALTTTQSLACDERSHTVDTQLKVETCIPLPYLEIRRASQHSIFQLLTTMIHLSAASKNAVLSGYHDASGSAGISESCLCQQSTSIHINPASPCSVAE
jgi:hypothetical protein